MLLWETLFEGIENVKEMPKIQSHHSHICNSMTHILSVCDIAMTLSWGDIYSSQKNEINYLAPARGPCSYIVWRYHEWVEMFLQSLKLQIHTIWPLINWPGSTFEYSSCEMEKEVPTFINIVAFLWSATIYSNSVHKLHRCIIGVTQIHWRLTYFKFKKNTIVVNILEK